MGRIFQYLTFIKYGYSVFGTCTGIPLHCLLNESTMSNHQNISTMNRAIVITPHVLNTLRSLPLEERLSVASALAGEMILGTDTPSDLEPMESMIYSIIKFYVNQASDRYNNSLSM